ncbi:MAG: isoquinoline 1-oxidoreductase subunit beta [Thermoleophilaceae bacterium]|nr:isoquinoline 1-oxidoreductase subunit beta [Thermoleophilaceae bacterium]
MGESTQVSGISRRRFVGYLIAAPTLVAAAELGVAEQAGAAIPTHQPVDLYDLSDLLTDAARPTANLIKVVVNPDGTASFDMPRAEVGQGITTAVAMTIADELDLAVDKVHVTLADARPELIWNQITGGSNSMHAIFTPVRVAASIARGALLQAAAQQLGVPQSQLSIRDGVITAPGGRSATFGELSRLAAVSATTSVRAQLKPRAQLKLVGTPQRRIDALDIVTGRKRFAMELDVPGAKPTMVCRPPTINGSARAVRNLAQVKAMPGITDVAIVPHTPTVAGGVAVRGATFGQCIDAIRALDVDWAPGSAEGKSDASVLADLKQAELPVPPPVNLLAKTLDQRFTFHFRPGDPLETNCAVADVRPASAEVWSSLKNPIWTKEQLALNLGLPLAKVTVHVAQGGGSFGRHLFSDAAFEAAAISQKLGKPVKLLWHRTDNFRQGRVHPMVTSRVRALYLGSNVLTFDQRNTCVATDWSHGFGELLSAMGATLPGSNLGYAQTIFALTANVPYDFGVVTQLLNEVYAYNTFNTSAVRNVYSPEVTTPRELMVDQLAKAMGQDPYRYRRSFVREPRMRAVLDKVAQVGNWGRAMPAGTAQGIGIHREYKGFAACLVEIDCRPATVSREVPHAYTGPRVTKAVCAIDVGLPINPLGLEAQMMGGMMDGIGQVLTYSLHLKDGHFLEGSWDDAFYTRQWNTPPDLQVVVMPPTSDDPGGAGEFAVAPSMAATACAYARATGTLPTSFPINHNRADLGFEVFPTVPPIPQSPTDGLQQAH